MVGNASINIHPFLCLCRWHERCDGKQHSDGPCLCALQREGLTVEMAYSCFLAKHGCYERYKKHGITRVCNANAPRVVVDAQCGALHIAVVARLYKAVAVIAANVVHRYFYFLGVDSERGNIVHRSISAWIVYHVKVFKRYLETECFHFSLSIFHCARCFALAQV